MTAGLLQLDAAGHRVLASGEEIRLGPTEYRLLHFLLTHPERVYSRAQLLDRVWGANVYVEESSRKFVVGMLLFLAAGAIIGWIYGEPLTGLLVAAIAALAWQVRQLLAFERALRTGDADRFRYGEGIWQQLYSRFHYEREKAGRRKQGYRQLLKEVRKSTNAMPDGAVILNTDNEIIACNRAAKDLAGLKRKKDRGQRVDNIVRDPLLAELLHDEARHDSVDIASRQRLPRAALAAHGHYRLSRQPCR